MAAIEGTAGVAGEVGHMPLPWPSGEEVPGPDCWCGLKGWDKARQRGVYQPFILGMQPVTLVAIYLMRPSSSAATQPDWKTLAFVPAALLGAWFGLRIFKRLSDRQFELVVNALLINFHAALLDEPLCFALRGCKL